MRQTLVLLGALALLVAQPLNAAETAHAPLSPGKPAGVKPAQASSLLNAYAPALVFGALLAITIGVSGNSQPVNTQSVSTNFCCG